MKITIEPTEGHLSDCAYPKVSIEVGDDACDLDKIADMMKGALIAWGFHPDTVAEIFGNESEAFPDRLDADEN